jgi:hypothetical protein
MHSQGFHSMCLHDPNQAIHAPDAALKCGSKDG